MGHVEEGGGGTGQELAPTSCLSLHLSSPHTLYQGQKSTAPEGMGWEAALCHVLQGSKLRPAGQIQRPWNATHILSSPDGSALPHFPANQFAGMRWCPRRLCSRTPDTDTNA